MISKELKVESRDVGKRADQFLADNFADLSRSKLSKMITRKDVLINNKVVKPSYTVKEGDVLTIGDMKNSGKNVGTPKGENIKLDIIFEDNDVIVVNKQAGIVIHPADGNQSGTLVNALVNYYPKIVDAIYDEDSNISHIRPGIVHRLDKETSGVMIIAKNKESLEFLTNEMRARRVEKKYLAICLDNFPSKFGEIRNRLIRHPKERKHIAVSENEKGKEAITRYKVIKLYKYNNQNISLIEFQILTGRTHQIRVHAKSLNSPVIGDTVYGTKASNQISKELDVPRVLLHSFMLAITLPNGEKKTFIIKMPSDFDNIIEKIS